MRGPTFVINTRGIEESTGMSRPVTSEVALRRGQGGPDLLSAPVALKRG